MNIKTAAAFAISITSALTGCLNQPSSKIGDEPQSVEGSDRAYIKGTKINVPVKGLDEVEVGLVDPTGLFYWLVSDGITCSGVLLKGDLLSIEIKGLVGVAEINNELSKERVFKEDGAYTVVIADNLETELENSFSRSFDVHVNKEVLSLVDDHENNGDCEVD